MYLVNESFYVKVKRFLGIFLATVGLLILLPLFGIVALLIKVSEPKGSIFFKQIRVGKAGKTFEIYKFRTMKMDAEKELQKYLELNEVSGPMFKIKKDPRITRIGKILRKTSIDELPQLLNVLKGDMALIGPRPPLPREVEVYTAYDKQRLQITPGCTGMWQVSGRNTLSFHEMVELDLFYIRNVSPSLDAKILCRTVLVLFHPKGAY
ncbi:hypothetical protein UR08_07675 [Listeria kieliensis]|uniref:Bacterial sugar transferase domain-containing protein n=1 Tax=Listeria kieliensis TaxID=1621700 RepID=A0A3D8TRY0_9LIST|nr:hypothetical protein UR08_07675 [Listeria kieliensis]